MLVLIILVLLAAFEVLPHGFLTPAVIALLVLFPVLILAEGIIAPIEFLSTLSNILSYARIMALGTASVMMAVVANELAGSIGSVLVGVLFALLFHLVNFALGIFAPTIHGLRLHYVEFFGKFHSPGGQVVSPVFALAAQRDRRLNLRRSHGSVPDPPQRRAGRQRPGPGHRLGAVAHRAGHLGEPGRKSRSSAPPPFSWWPFRKRWSSSGSWSRS